MSNVDFKQLDQQLRESFADLNLDNAERDELRELGTILDPERTRFLRNRAFDLVRQIVTDNDLDKTMLLQALKWLEQVNKTLNLSLEQQRITSQAYFTPGNDCRNEIIALCQSARHFIDVCVFTISDDKLSDALITSYKRGVKIRIVTDNDKQYDLGSDIADLLNAGIPLRTDHTPGHMHHKFAIFDRHILLNGSFNWTSSATNSNKENLLTTDNPALIKGYLAEFEKLWEKYKPVRRNT